MNTNKKINLSITEREAHILMGVLSEHVIFLEDEGDDTNDLCPELKKQYEDAKHLLGYIEEAALD